VADRDLRPLAVTGAVAVVSVGLLVLAVAGDWLGSDVGRGDVFCEVPHDLDHVFQPANSLSNLGFVVAGLAVAWRAGRPELLGDVLPRLRRLPTAYAVVTVLLGPASAAMHATGSVLGGHLDLLSMYLIASFAAAYALMRLVRQGAVFFFQVFLLMVAACELVGTIDAEVPVVHIAGHNRNLLVDVPYGSGRVIYLSDPYITSNGGLNIVDNAQLALNILAAGSGSVAFDEYHQGYGANANRVLQFFEGTPVIAIFGQSVLLIALLFFSQSRRFARPVPEREPDRRWRDRAPTACLPASDAGRTLPAWPMDRCDWGDKK